MRSTFSLFQSHLDLAKTYWQMLLKPEDWVIDATCGNGKDCLFLASLIPRGRLFGIDIQKSAINNTECLLRSSLPHAQNVHLYQQSHGSFPKEIPEESIQLVVYNLGYLPGGDKELVTLTEETLKSVQAATKLLKKGGVITITCYPGHAEGKKEETFLTSFCHSLSPKEWSVCHHQWLNREKAPSLLVIQKMQVEPPSAISPNPTTFL